MISDFLLKKWFEIEGKKKKKKICAEKKAAHLSSAVSADERDSSKFFIGIHDYAKRKKKYQRPIHPSIYPSKDK